MRGLIIAVILAAVPASAELKFEGNPDKVPSLGLNYSVIGMIGTYNSTSFSGNQFSANGLPYKMTQGGFDLRFPVSDHLTLSGAFGISRLQMGLRDNSATYTGGIVYDTNVYSSYDFQGFYGNIGMRYYFY